MIARVLLCLLLVAFPVVLSAQADGQARRILDQPPYKGYRVEKVRQPSPGESDGDWQGRSDGSDQPAQRQVQGDGSEGEPTYRPGDQTGRRRGSQAEGRPGGGGRDAGESSSTPDFSGLGWIGQVFEVLVWVVLAVAVVAGLFFLVKAILGIKFDKKKAKKSKAKRAGKAPVEAGTPDADAGATEIPEEVFVDALAAAQQEYEQALKAEDWGRAALLAYRIFWLRAGWRGCVESADVRTWRDALRLVKGVETRQQVRGLLRLVENVRYGAHAPDRDEFTVWRTELEALNPREVVS